MFQSDCLYWVVESPHLITHKQLTYRTIFLISRIHLTYKFVILDTKRKQNIFLVFLKYRLNSHDFNKLVIKTENAC